MLQKLIDFAPVVDAIQNQVTQIRVDWATLDDGLASFLKIHAGAEIKKPREAM